MEIKLDLIAPSPRPVRTSWDEDKMNELAQSIREQGLIVPIKVRPLSDYSLPCELHGMRWLENGWYEYYDDGIGEMRGCSNCFTSIEHIEWVEDDEGELIAKGPLFEIVYGHRRAEACRRAGLAEIECIVEGVDNTNVLIQALIENVQREDMTPLDQAKAVGLLQAKTGWTHREMARQGIMPRQTIDNLVALLEEPEEIQAIVGRGEPGFGGGQRISGGYITPKHVQRVRESGLEQPDRTKILKKAAEEEWTVNQSRQAAEAYRDAKDDREREAVLKVDPRGRDAFEMQAGVEDMVELEQERKAKAFQEYDAAVKEFLESMRLFNAVIETAQSAVNYGKFSPEGARFAAGRVERLIDELTTLKEELDAIGNE
jgi:ParB-like chromosome segregation protein Spo0J